MTKLSTEQAFAALEAVQRHTTDPRIIEPLRLALVRLRELEAQPEPLGPWSTKYWSNSMTDYKQHSSIPMFTVKCIGPSATHYCCQVESWVEAVAFAHLLAETYGHRANVYKPNETHHAYSAPGNPDVTARLFT